MATVPRAVLIGALTGLLSAVGLVYYASKAVSPGILGMFTITAIAVLFGIFVSLCSTALLLIFNLKKFFTYFGACNNCRNKLPSNAVFCPHCGAKALTWEIKNFS